MHRTASTGRTPLAGPSSLNPLDVATSINQIQSAATPQVPLPLPLDTISNKLTDNVSEYTSDSDQQEDEPNDHQEEQPTELECALQVGQYLLDQNQDLEMSLKASREETEWLLSVLAKLDPDLVSEAMAADDDAVIGSTLATKNESELVAQLRHELAMAASELDELRDQVQAITSRNTALRIQNLDLLMQQGQQQSSSSTNESTNSIVTDLETRIKEYDTLVQHLKAQLTASQTQISEMNGLKTPQQTPSRSIWSFVSSEDDNGSGSSPILLGSGGGGSRRVLPQERQDQHQQQPTPDISHPSSSFFTDTIPRTNQPRRNTENGIPQQQQQQQQEPITQPGTLVLQTPNTTTTQTLDTTQQPPSSTITVQNVTTHVQVTNTNQQSPASINTTNINVIVRLMIGSHLLKYNRRRTKCEMRFVNVNPYSRTISWSKREPGSAGGGDEVTTVYMQTVFVEDLTDGRSRIVVCTPSREVCFQCGSALEHAIWERGLTLILQNHSKNMIGY
ncbi:UNVERIFIED_CONTAM: hypothetical protein HDU68_009028 [Siphonaria sp. JEL0065]|nr:hypothetical protein HDU68_009028 [Siphonaria sp. JEL0065]